MDKDPHFNTNPEFVEGDDGTPGRIPPQVRCPEYRADATRDLSSDTEAALTMQAVTLDAPPASETAAGDVRRVELTPLPGIEQGADLEKEIQCRIQQESHRLVRDVLRRSSGLAQRAPILGICPSDIGSVSGKSLSRHRSQCSAGPIVTATVDSSCGDSVQPFRGD